MSCRDFYQHPIGQLVFRIQTFLHFRHSSQCFGEKKREKKTPGIRNKWSRHVVNFPTTEINRHRLFMSIKPMLQLCISELIYGKQSAWWIYYNVARVHIFPKPPVCLCSLRSVYDDAYWQRNTGITVMVHTYFMSIPSGCLCQPETGRHEDKMGL